MRYKLLIAGAGIAGLLLVLQGVGVLGAGLRTTRSSTPPVVLAAAVSTRPAQKAAVVDLANTVNPAQDRAVSTPLTYAAASQPAPAVVATALPTVPPEAVAAARRSQVLPTPTPMANGARPQLINGLPIESIVVMPAAVQQNVREIYARGQALGRNSRTFSKVGDSTMLWPLFLVNFDWGHYRLGNFAELQRTVQRFAGSFSRESLAVQKGMHSWGQFDPGQADATRCAGGEGPLACELRINNPSVVLIRLGANDSLEPSQYESAMRRILATCIASGVVPVLGTKPDHFEGPENTINQIIRRLAVEYRVPLWDFDLAAETIPGRGLQGDGLHLMEGGTDDYALATSLGFIGPLEDLSALLTLDAVGQVAQ